MEETYNDKMIQPEDILDFMGRQVLGICQKVYPQERPNAVTARLDTFIVVSNPYSMSNRTVGETDDWWLDQTVSIEVYVRDRKSASDPKELDLATMKAMREQVLARFPMFNAELGFKVTRPRVVIPASSDGNGYHYTRIQARMSTMV